MGHIHLFWESFAPGLPIPSEYTSAADAEGFYHLCIHSPPPAWGYGAPAPCAHDLCVHLSRPCLQSLLHSRAQEHDPEKCQRVVLPLQKSPSCCITAGRRVSIVHAQT